MKLKMTLVLVPFICICAAIGWALGMLIPHTASTEVFYPGMASILAVLCSVIPATKTAERIVEE